MVSNGDLHQLRAGQEILLFDLAEFDELNNVTRSVCRAQKHPNNPVMEQGDTDAWDSAQASPWALRTVLFDEQDQLFKVWYNGTDFDPHTPIWWQGYATSQDGVIWQKPNLGLYELDGSTRNNILGRHIYGCIIKDENEPDPARRYKQISTGEAYYSPDGINWSEKQSLEMSFPGPRPWDPVACIRDEQDPDPQRRYKFVYQYYDELKKAPGRQCRMKGLAFSPDSIKWTASADNPVLSPNDGFEHENHFLMLIPYKGQYLMLYECGWYHPDGTGNHGAYTADIRLAHSRDGEHFTRIAPHQPVISVGGPGEWDGQFIVISEKVIVKDGRIYLYYCGQGTDWTSWPPKNKAEHDRFVLPGTPHNAVGKIRLSRMGLATLPDYGFTCVHTIDDVSFGSLTSKPLQLGEEIRNLTVNLSDTRPRRDWLQVEVLNSETLLPLSGFSRDDCSPILTEGCQIPVRWGGRNLSNLINRAPICLRFWLFGAARLYSFQVMQ